MLSYLLLSLVLVLLAYRRYTRYAFLSHIPGPQLAAWTSLAHVQWIIKGDIFDRFAKYRARYGTLIRIAPDHLVTSDPEIIRRMNGSKSTYRRSDYYDTFRFKPGMNNVLSTRDEKDHQNLRSKLASGYSGKDVAGIEQIIDKTVTELIELIERKYISSASNYYPMDLAEKAFFYTVDAISAIAFGGKNFGHLKEDKDVLELMAEFDNPVMPYLSIWPWLMPYLEFLLKRKIIPGLNDTAGLGRIVRVAEKLLAERWPDDGKVNEDKNDLMGSFVRHGLSRDQVESEIVLAIPAGIDNTATAMRTILTYVASNSSVARKLRKEIDESEGIVSDVKARNMVYLQACIREGLRLAPPIISLLSKEVPAEGDTINGLFVPGGTKIGWAQKPLHRDETLFGPDADIFRPERWILTAEGGHCESAEKLAQMRRHNDLVWAYGRTKCLGMDIAMMELNKVVVELLRRFEISLCNPKRPADVDYTGISHAQYGLWVRITRRER